MPNKKISELPAISGDLDGTELMPVVHGGATKRATVDEVLLIATDAAAAAQSAANDAQSTADGAAALSIREVAFVTTSNDTLSGLAARDGYTPIAGELALATTQTTTADNGLWLTAAGAWTRPAFFDSNADVVPGTQWQVTSGTLGANTTWRLKSGNTIAGDKVVERIDTATVLGIDLTRPPYNISATGNVQDALNLAISDASTAGGAALRLPPAITVSQPIELRSNVILEGMPARSSITQNYSAGPIIHTRGYGGMPTSATALSSAEDLSFALDHTQTAGNKRWLNLTHGGLYLKDLTELSWELECAISNASVGTHIVSCQGRLAAGWTNETCFRLGVTAAGAVSAELRVGGVDYALSTSAGSVTIDGTTKYHLALDYDGATIRLWATVMGAASATPGATPATQVGYASVAATGTVEQYPFEVTHLGHSFCLDFPEGAQLETALSGRIGSMRIGDTARRTAAFTAPSTVLTIDVAGGGIFLLSPRTAHKFSDGELWRFTPADGGFGFLPARSDNAGTTCVNAGVRNVKLICGNSVDRRGSGIIAHRAVGFIADNIEITSAYIGMALTNNSYLSSVGNFKISCHASGYAGLLIGSASGVTTIYGQNQIEATENVTALAIRVSGLSLEGQTYITAQPSAYCGVLITSAATCDLSGIQLSDENSSQVWGLSGLFIAPTTGKQFIRVNGNWEMFNTDSAPVVISAETTADSTIELSGRIVQSDPAGYAIRFDGDPDDIADVSTGNLAVSNAGEFTNAPGKVRTSAPLASVVLTAQDASIGTTDLFANPPVAGTYAVSIYLANTILDAGAGTVLVTIGWTDAAGATTAATTTLAMTALGRLEGTVKVKTTGAANITYATTVAGTPGAARYALDVLVQRID
jgi:hypothetical protein